ncbi:MAG: hypothetical protein LBS99_02275 [Clostridiales bacterium]|jgi:hypothetical protein|nr:hypothetical protein [Clostridiales bacterium]
MFEAKTKINKYQRDLIDQIAARGFSENYSEIESLTGTLNADKKKLDSKIAISYALRNKKQKTVLYAIFLSLLILDIVGFILAIYFNAAGPDGMLIGFAVPLTVFTIIFGAKRRRASGEARYIERLSTAVSIAEHKMTELRTANIAQTRNIAPSDFDAYCKELQIWVIRQKTARDDIIKEITKLEEEERPIQRQIDAGKNKYLNDYEKLAKAMREAVHGADDAWLQREIWAIHDKKAPLTAKLKEIEAEFLPYINDLTAAVHNASATEPGFEDSIATL